MSRATGDAIRAFQKQQEEVQAIKATLYNYKEDHELLTNVASLVVEMLVSNYKDIYEFIEVCPHIVPQNRPVIQRRVITTLIEENFSIFILTTSDNKTLAIFPTKKRLFFVSLFFNALLSGFE